MAQTGHDILPIGLCQLDAHADCYGQRLLNAGRKLHGHSRRGVTIMAKAVSRAPGARLQPVVLCLRLVLLPVELTGWNASQLGHPGI